MITWAPEPFAKAGLRLDRILSISSGEDKATFVQLKKTKLFSFGIGLWTKRRLEDNAELYAEKKKLCIR